MTDINGLKGGADECLGKINPGVHEIENNPVRGVHEIENDPVRGVSEIENNPVRGVQGGQGAKFGDVLADQASDATDTAETESVVKSADYLNRVFGTEDAEVIRRDLHNLQALRPSHFNFMSGYDLDDDTVTLSCGTTSDRKYQVYYVCSGVGSEKKTDIVNVVRKNTPYGEVK